MLKKLLIAVVFVILALAAGVFFYLQGDKGVQKSVRVYIPRGATAQSVKDSLVSTLGDDYGTKVYNFWKVESGDVAKANGSYVVNPGEKAYSVAHRIANGRQTPVRLTVNVARTLGDLSQAIASKVEATHDEISAAIDSVVADGEEYSGKAQFIAAILPDTYEVYWNESPEKIIATLTMWRDRFWNDDRRAKAAALGLTPVEVTTLASIVEEESNKSKEQPVIARLYLNRLEKGMKLQADPTVKFAYGDFTIKRITSKHLDVESPYNTYKYAGLPPGPIRMPQKATIDAVLDAPHNNYLYMCAKEDFSGYHNFAVDYNTHLKNARRYVEALNKRGIH